MIDYGKDLQNAFDDGYKARDDEIVRCKDCKYYWKNNKYEQEPVCLASPNDDAFCSEGERKEREDETRENMG